MELAHWTGEKPGSTPKVALRFESRTAYNIKSLCTSVPYANTMTTGNNTVILYSEELTKW